MQWLYWCVSVLYKYSSSSSNVCWPGVDLLLVLTDVSLHLAVALAAHRGTRWRRWLRHCATGRKVVGLIPDGVIGIFY